MVVLGGRLFLMSELPLYPYAKVRAGSIGEPGKAKKKASKPSTEQVSRGTFQRFRCKTRGFTVQEQEPSKCVPDRAHCIWSL